MLTKARSHELFSHQFSDIVIQINMRFAAVILIA